MISIKTVRAVIRSTLVQLTYTKSPMYSPEAEEMLLMIAAHESLMGKYLSQVNGPALGIYQMEPATLIGNYENYLRYRNLATHQVYSTSGIRGICLKSLQYNPIYSTIHARIKLYRSPGKLPRSTDIDNMADYCKKYYNSPEGKATAKDYADAYNVFIK